LGVQVEHPIADDEVSLRLHGKVLYSQMRGMSTAKTVKNTETRDE
jgi:hypothetical protein